MDRGGTSTRPDSEQYYSHGLRQRFHLDGLKVAASAPDNMSYADIDYDIDPAKYQARSCAIVQAGGLETDVPDGWPKEVLGPLIWSSSDFQDEDSYVVHLSDADRRELDEALESFKAQGLNGEEVQRANFPIPNLEARLEIAAADVYNGKGFVVLRGLKPDAYPIEDFTVLYSPKQRSFDNRPDNNARPFHTDTVCDCLALVTRGCSVTGGRTIIASAWTVYNELARTRPDIIHTLSKPDWPFDTFGRDPTYYRRALLYCHEGKPILNFSRRLLLGHSPGDVRTPGIPGLSEKQAEAMDALHFLATKHAVKAPMEKGDIRFINNMGLMHRREAFEVRSDRHLIRLWLNNPERCWALPEPLQLAWARVFDDKERGTFWDIDPPREHGVVLRVAGSCD